MPTFQSDNISYNLLQLPE